MSDDAEGQDEAAPDRADEGGGSRRRRRPRRSAAGESKSKSEGSSATADAGAPKSDEPETDKSPSGGDPEQRMDLPKWNRARVKRKAPAGQEEDAFVGTVRKAGRLTIQRAPVVLGLIVLAAGAIAGGVYLSGRRSESAATATRILADAASYEARGQIVPADQLPDRKGRPYPIPVVSDPEELTAKVDEALGNLDSEAEDSNANKMAGLVRAARLLKQGSFADAETEYRGFLAAFGDGHALSYLAREGLGFSLEGQDDLAGALAEFQALAGESGEFYRDLALWHQGRVYERMDNPDEALKVYHQYLEEFPLDKPSLAQQQVRRRLQELDPDAVPPLPGGLPIQLPGMTP